MGAASCLGTKDSQGDEGENGGRFAKKNNHGTMKVSPLT